MEASYSLQFNHSVKSDSFATAWIAAHQASCPSPTLRVCSNSYPSSRWCHPIISCSVVPFSLPSVFPSIRVFSNGSALHIRWPSKSIGASASALVLPMNIHGRFTVGLTGWISLQSKGLSRVFSNPTVKSISSSTLSLLYDLTLTSIHDHWENHSFD